MQEIEDTISTISKKSLKSDSGTISKKSLRSNSGTTISKKSLRSDSVDPSIFEPKPRETTFDDALTHTGTGRFHFLVLLCGGMVFLACGLQNGLNAYILPSCKCDFKLTSAEMGLLNALFLAGGISSAYLNGAVADSLGRRPAMVAALLGDAVCSLLAIVAPNFAVLGTLRFASGFLVGGPAALVFLYVSEYLPIARRPPYMLLLGLFWTVSWMMLPGLAWVIMPAKWPMLLPIPLSPWRVFTGLMAIPSVIGAICVWKMPETPQFLYSRGHTQESLNVMIRIYVSNTGKSSSEYPVKILQEPPGAKEGITPSKSAVVTALRVLKGQLTTLFTPPVLSRNMIGLLAVFCNMFTYYGLVLWLPELISRFEAHYSLFPDRTVTMCELTRIWPDELAEATLKANSTGLISAVNADAACRAAAVKSEVFIQTLIISSACLVANIISAVIASKINRKTMPISLNFISGALVVAVYFVDSSLAVLIVASLFQAAMSTGNIALNGLLVDLFPPNVSALGVVTAVLAGRLGAVISNMALGILIDIQCEVPLLLLVIMAALSGIICCFVPPPFGKGKDDRRIDYETRRRSMSAAAA